jgi:Asp-tRNA(Asn)/Glu-tRNA(Gln) amidotransferase B subunit
VDVNVSIGKGAPCELKNLVSLKLIQQAIGNISTYSCIMIFPDAEISRQRELIHNRQTVEPSTRRVEKTTLTTTTNLLRMKENYRDYKIFPDPDIPVLLIAPHISETIGNNLPDLPDATKLLIVRGIVFLSEYFADQQQSQNTG